MKKNLVIKFIATVVIFLFSSSAIFAGVKTGYKLGKGPLKITKNTADILEYYFSGGKKGYYAAEQKLHWKPGLIAVSADGAHSAFFRHPIHITEIDNKHYGGMAIADCQKKSGQECFLFANSYKIVWDNGSDKKKRRLKSKDIKAGKTIARLTELGFYDGSTNLSNSTNTKTNETKNNDDTNSNNVDVVEKLKELKELFDSGAITKEEFDKAKKKILN
jgi:hypothetical protein|tara:strand:+ start:48 stop:701 length:654 start_codon:yes stop_codon:yes gene_type:complete